MGLKNKNILLISPEPWNHIFVSKHHYAIQLGQKGNTVYFLNPPSVSSKVTKSDYQNVLIVDYKGFPKGLRLYPRFLSKFFMRKVYDDIQKKCSKTFEIVWSFDNSVFFDFSALPDPVVKINHIVDLNQNFQLHRSASTSDICLCTSEAIKMRLEKYNNRVFKINHGVNFTKTDEEEILPGHNSIKALYVGNLAIPYIDWEILSTAARKNRDIDFVFIGPGVDQAKKLLGQDLDHVYFLGGIPSNLIIKHLLSADILLIAYKADLYADQLSNPHKIMEYLSTGKPIVTTYTKEYEHNNDLFIMSRQNFEWPLLLRMVADNLSDYNYQALSRKRIAYALDNSYEKQVNRIELLIQKYVVKNV